MTDRVHLRADTLSLSLDPDVGGSIAAFVYNDAPLMRPAPDGNTDALTAACFPLVPFVNRVRDGRFSFRGRTIQLADNMPGQKHPLHGQGWRNPWRVESASETTAELSFRHEPADWRWTYEARQAFDLDAEGLSVRLSCRNRSNEPMPCGLGLHPYFPCTAQTVLDTGVEAVWTIDGEVMPVERVPAEGRYDLRQRLVCSQDLDNGFDGWSGSASIRWPERDLGLTITAAAPRFQLYSPREGGLFVAEPVTNANAALNRPESEWEAAGLVLLGPGEETALEVRFEVSGPGG